MPKELLAVFDKPVIHYIVDELVQAGVDELIFIIPPEGSLTPAYFKVDNKLDSYLEKKGKQSLIKKVNHFMDKLQVYTVVQKEPKGDGHAILQAENILSDDDFFVYFGDEILDSSPSSAQQLLKAQKEKASSVLGVQAVTEEEISRFGIVKLKVSEKAGAMELDTLVEKPAPKDAPSNLALLGKNICSPDIFTAIKKADISHGGELRLSDAFLNLVQNNKKVYVCELLGQRFDTGNPEGLLAAGNYFAQKNLK